VHIFILALMLAIHSPGTIAKLKNEAIKPIESPQSINSKDAKLGEELYNNKLFSNNNEISCATCHNLNLRDKLNSENNYPTLYNVVLNSRFFHDGRAKTIDDVLDEHIQDKNVFDSNWNDILNKLNKTDQHKTKSESLNIIKIKQLINAYLQTLITPSAFDRYLLGDNQAISKQAKDGYMNFKTYGCNTCHQGPNIGGNLYQKMGVYEPYFSKKSHITDSELGRYNTTKNENDKFVYRVPSLRNIALTPPYFHDGSAKNLEEALTVMGKPKIGNDIPERDIPEMIEFLKTLTGDKL
jgi:cytochrome c peroxidase